MYSLYFFFFAASLTTRPESMYAYLSVYMCMCIIRLCGIFHAPVPFSLFHLFFLHNSSCCWLMGPFSLLFLYCVHLINFGQPTPILCWRVNVFVLWVCVCMFVNSIFLLFHPWCKCARTHSAYNIASRCVFVCVFSRKRMHFCFFYFLLYPVHVRIMHYCSFPRFSHNTFFL